MAKVIVGKTSDIPQGKMSHATAGGKEILVANVEGSYYAINDICNHAGAELHEGELAGKELTCPWHGAKWDATTGNLIWFPQKLKDLESYKVSVENETVYVEV
ncbi:non-heme iron oxygenase ferredoxin subunit [soil metagenome]|jgi:nitrite reductase/ring-hydroxylating ferredoxin subunit